MTIYMFVRKALVDHFELRVFSISFVRLNLFSDYQFFTYESTSKLYRSETLAFNHLLSKSQIVGRKSQVPLLVSSKSILSGAGRLSGKRPDLRFIPFLISEEEKTVMPMGELLILNLQRKTKLCPHPLLIIFFPFLLKFTKKEENKLNVPSLPTFVNSIIEPPINQIGHNRSGNIPSFFRPQ